MRRAILLLRPNERLLLMSNASILELGLNVWIIDIESILSSGMVMDRVIVSDGYYSKRRSSLILYDRCSVILVVYFRHGCWCDHRFPMKLLPLYSK